MQVESILYISYTVVSITLSAVLALLFWSRRNVNSARWLALMMSAAALWGLCDFLSDLSNGSLYKLYWENASYFGIVTIPVAWFIFAIQYTENEKYLAHGKLFLLPVIPLVTVLMTWTNGFHHLMLSKIEFVKTGQLTVLAPSFGVWFWVHAAYSYSLLLLGTFFLVKKLVTLPRIMRSHSVIMITAILVPLILNVLYTFKVNPAYPIDPTIFSFAFTGIFCFWGMFRYRLFELVPLARNAVIDDMSEILIVLDTENHIIDINSIAKEFFGIKGENFIGKPVVGFLKEWSSYFVKYEHVMKAEEKLSIDTKNGRRYFDLKITPLFDNRSKLIGRFFILHDITALEDAINDLEESRRQAEDANKAKSRFLATMSHEIRTPLGGIIGIAELLGQEYHTEKARGYLQTIQSCAGALLDVINNVLDFSKIEAGKMELEETVFNLENLLDSTVKLFSHQAEEKNIEFTCSMDRTITGNVVGDPVRLKQILINLIGNAFKFTEKGKIEVRVRQFELEEHSAMLQFSVIDTGIGVPEDKIEGLFKSFQQMDSSTARKYGGTGLGLAIVKELVALMNGYIDVESNPGVGSRFSFTIPFKMQEEEVSKEQPNSEIDFHGRDITVLLAEDSRVNQMLVTMLLEKKNIKTDVAENGKEAFDMLERKAYDLILMDIQMPEMDGYETAMAIRRREEGTGRHIPIIALTANATELDKNECITAGMDDYLTKPIKTKKLYECIYRHVFPDHCPPVA